MLELMQKHSDFSTKERTGCGEWLEISLDSLKIKIKKIFSV
jgi:hypothetical protein